MQLVSACRSNDSGHTAYLAHRHSYGAASAVRDNVHSLKAELDEIATALHRSEQSYSVNAQHIRSKQQARQERHNSFSSQPHVGQHNGQFHSSRAAPASAGKLQGSYSELLTRRQREASMSDPIHKPAADRQWKQDKHAHIQSNLDAEDAQLQDDWKQSRQRDGPERRLGPMGGSRGPSPRSVLGCSSLHSLPVLNNSFIVPAQAAKPKKVDRVTRHRCDVQAWLCGLCVN